MSEYYVLLNGQQTGPYSIEQLRSMWQLGAINPTTLYWQTGMPSWFPLATIQHLLGVPPNTPYPVYQQYQPMPFYQQQPMIIMRPAKSRAAFILLGLFLGGFGIHNFYAGYAGKGVAQLLITLLAGWLIVPLLIVGIWVLVEIIAVDTDVTGVKMI